MGEGLRQQPGRVGEVRVGRRTVRFSRGRGLVLVGIVALAAVSCDTETGLAPSAARAVNAVTPIAVGIRPVFWGPVLVQGSEHIKLPMRVSHASSFLRVSVDSPASGHQLVFSVSVRTPEGRMHEVVPNSVSEEVLIPVHEQGIYLTEIKAHADSTSALRVRARIEEVATETGLPNLQPEPPFELTTGLPRGAGHRSCWPYERRQEGARLCLRFSFGLRNVGSAPLALRFGRGTQGEHPVSVTQEVHTRGRHDRPAGRAEFHRAHRHYHLKDLLVVRVVPLSGGDTGRTGTKVGFCLHDFALVEWETFFPRPPTEPRRSDCDPPKRARGSMYLSPGWMELYHAATVGNYVDVRGLPRGKYLLKVVLDAGKKIRESNEDDNTSFAVFELRGARVRLISRGFGERHTQWTRADTWWEDFIQGSAR